MSTTNARSHLRPCGTLPCTSTTDRSGPAGGGVAVRHTPKPAQASSPASPNAVARRPSAGVAASSTVASVSPCTPIQPAGCCITSPSAFGIAHTLPHGFHGNPVATNWRSRSASTQAPANTSARRQPARARQATAQAAAMNTASTAASAGTASGTSHQNRADSIRIASVIQYSPIR